MKGHVPKENLPRYRQLGQERVALLNHLANDYRSKHKQAPTELLEAIERLRLEMLELRVEMDK